MDMLSKEWSQLMCNPAGIHDQVTKGAMPISYDIMYSFQQTIRYVYADSWW